MTCRYLHLYNLTGVQWMVASCSARTTPYVPATSELETFCRGGAHITCPSFLYPAAPPDSATDRRATPLAEKAGTA